MNEGLCYNMGIIYMGVSRNFPTISLHRSLGCFWMEWLRVRAPEYITQSPVCCLDIHKYVGMRERVGL